MDLIRRAQSLGDHEWAETVDGAEAFDSWLQQTVALPEPGRAKQLTAWRTAPGADTCHDDTPDHFMPLLVAAGAATTALGTVIYRDRPAQKLPQSMFRFG
jgi:aromatic ring-opening dioxygenase catalytic subunit (LigB family)